MPQTLSLIGRGHSGPQGYTDRTNQQNSSPQGQQQQPTITNDNYPTRHNYPGQFNQINQSYKNSNFSQPQNSISSNSNYPSFAGGSYNQIQNTDNQNDKVKFEGKNDNQRFEVPTKLESNQHKFEQLAGTHQYGKHDQHDARITKYEGNLGLLKGENKVENLNQKYETNQGKHDHGVKLEPPIKGQESKGFEADRKISNFGEKEDKMKPALPPKPVKPNPPPRLNSQDKDATGDTGDGKSNVTR